MALEMYASPDPRLRIEHQERAKKMVYKITEAERDRTNRIDEARRIIEKKLKDEEKSRRLKEEQERKKKADETRKIQIEEVNRAKEIERENLKKIEERIQNKSQEEVKTDSS